MTAPTMTTEAAAYLAAVEHELADLPADERSELLEDLAMHLQELEEEHDERPLEVRLGSAQTYAAELRTAAGLPARSTPKGQRLERFFTAVGTFAQHRYVSAVRNFLPELRPAWWVLRGYLVVLVPCALQSGGRGFMQYLGGPFHVGPAARHFPVPAPFDSHWLGAFLVMAAIVVSVKVGSARPSRMGAAAVVGLNAVLLVALAVLTLAASDRLARTQVVYVEQAPQGPLNSPYGPLTNIFPYSADGKPLEGVLLYDQDGRPLRVGTQEWWKDECARVKAQPKAADGVPVPQSYPQQYVLDPRGTTVYDSPVGAGQCQELARPAVPLPTFPKPR